jgi:DNA-binding HxlR family transcriptional regulator
LTITLKRMIEDGLVDHREVSRFPRTTLYSLTPQAYEVLAALEGVDAWYAARRRYWQQRTDEVMQRGPLRLLSRSIRP